MKTRNVMIIALSGILMTSCMTSVYPTQQPAMVDNVDIDETIKIAVVEMEKDGMSKSLGIWVFRDQEITTEQAKLTSELYLHHIDRMSMPFNIWHASWAISNLYRHGNDEVKAELEVAYQKAKLQPLRLKGFLKNIAERHINGEKISTGFVHAGGRAYAKRHLVVPGNNMYVQSFDEYLEKQRK
jgi:hypothetical protein